MLRYVHGPVTDEIIATVDVSGSTFHHHDRAGSVIKLSTVTGDVVESYTYDVFGGNSIRNSQGTQIPSSAVRNRFMFTGREYRAELGLYDYRNRAYSSTVGRFLQPDPIRFEGRDNNLYRYVANNVINRADPFGLRSSIVGAGKFTIDSRCCAAVADLYSYLREDGAPVKIPVQAGRAYEADAFYLNGRMGKKIPDNMHCKVSCNRNGSYLGTRCARFPPLMGNSPTWFAGQPRPPGFPDTWPAP